jgi:hypothetical protein
MSSVASRPASIPTAFSTAISARRLHPARKGGRMDQRISPSPRPWSFSEARLRHRPWRRRAPRRRPPGPHRLFSPRSSAGAAERGGRGHRAKGATETPVVLFDAEEPGQAPLRPWMAPSPPLKDRVDLVIIAVGLLGDQLADGVDPVAAARVAAVNFSWPVAALAAVRARLRRPRIGSDPGHQLGRGHPGRSTQLPLRSGQGRSGPSL